MKLSRINKILLCLIILINGYIVVAPVIPTLTFWWDNRGGTKQKQLVAAIHTSKTSPTPAPTSKPADNEVIIPSMLLDQPILEGPVSQTYSILNHGIWRWPKSSTPDKGSNTVLIGHRFTYTQPKGALYYLNKVKMGDEIGITWNGTLYTYKVSSIRQVAPTEVSIQDPTSDSRLTIFTCTPLWLPKDRLVVVAELEPK